MTILTPESARADLLFKLPDYVSKHLKRCKTGFVCPVCGSGDGPKGTSAFAIGKGNFGRKWHCFSCQNKGDIFDLVSHVEGLKTFPEQLDHLAKLYGIEIDRGNRGGNASPKAAPKSAAAVMPELITPKPDKKEPDFMEQARKDLSLTDYLQRRGISNETGARYGLGYVAAWRHPNVSKKVPTSPRLIIPTAEGSYLARDIRPDNEIPERAKTYKKQKAGAAHLFNGQAIKAGGPLFVTEGELDALSIIEVGGDVGAVGLGSVDMKEVFLAALTKAGGRRVVILALDHDKAGKDTENDLKEKLENGGHIVLSLDYDSAAKDPNEALVKDRGSFSLAVEMAKAEAEEKAEIIKELELAEYQKTSAAGILEEFLKSIKVNGEAEAIQTGFPSVDDLLDGGLYPGMYVIGAISSLGKTTFCLQIADQAARAGHGVLFFSLEMAKEEILAKSISRETFLHSLEVIGDTWPAKTTRGILTGSRYASYSKAEMDVIKAALARYKEYAGNIRIYEGVGDIGVEEIRRKVEAHIKITGKAPLVIIDYLQILAPYDIRATDKQNTDKAVLELKRMSRDLSIPLLCISSFNREAYWQPVSKSSFKESGAIEYTSDVLLGLQYAGMDYTAGESERDRAARVRGLEKRQREAGRKGQAQDIELKILKNRNGRTGSSTLSYYPMFNTYEAREEETEEEEGGEE